MSRNTWISPALLIPMLLVIVAVAARTACQLLHVNPYPRAMIIAVIVNIVAAELAMIPLLMARGAEQLSVVQAGLISTVVQMFAAVALSGVAFYAAQVGQPFVFWVIPLYWVALAILVAAIVTSIKRATPLQTKAANP